MFVASLFDRPRLWWGAEVLFAGEWFLCRTFGDCHDDLVEQFAGSFREVNMAVGYGVESAGIDCLGIHFPSVA